MAKFCNKCLITKEVSEFYKRAYCSGYRGRCIKCMSKMGPNGRKKRLSKYSKEELRAKRLQVYKNLNSKPERKAKQAFYQATRVSRQINAAPKWLTVEQLSAVKAYYETAKILTLEFGVQMEVDHIIPLKGKDVCGLHVPWNLQIMVKEANRQKGNRLET